MIRFFYNVLIPGAVKVNLYRSSFPDIVKCGFLNFLYIFSFLLFACIIVSTLYTTVRFWIKGSIAAIVKWCQVCFRKLVSLRGTYDMVEDIVGYAKSGGIIVHVKKHSFLLSFLSKNMIVIIMINVDLSVFFDRVVSHFAPFSLMVYSSSKLVYSNITGKLSNNLTKTVQQFFMFLAF
ncbi:hypothetical protein ACJX0J_025742, partial [Zea mays]